MNKTNTLQVRTPEGIVFSQLLAGPVTRFLAWLVDFCCIAGIVIVINIAVSFFAIISPGVAVAIMVIGFFVITVGYSIVLEWSWRGQTVGKRLLRLRVVDAQGLRLHFSQIVIRNLLRMADFLPVMYLVGGIACLASRRAQRLGDLAANTVVIRLPQLTEPDLAQIFTDKFNSLHQYPHLEARLRQQVSPAEASVALSAILRREEFEPAARLELFAELAAHFHGKVAFPLEATDGITDEQYVRNVVDVLYRPRQRERAAQREPAAA